MFHKIKFTQNLFKIFRRNQSTLSLHSFDNLNPINCYNYFPMPTNQISIIGYNELARSCSLNLRDNNINIKIGLNQDDKFYIDEAISDGWNLGKDIVSIENATQSSDIIQVLINPINQLSNWNKIIMNISENKAVCFMNKLDIISSNLITFPNNIDIISISPSCNNSNLRNYFIESNDINGQIRIIQDNSGQSFDKSLYVAHYIGITNIDL